MPTVNRQSLGILTACIGLGIYMLLYLWRPARAAVTNCFFAVYTSESLVRHFGMISSILMLRLFYRC